MALGSTIGLTGSTSIILIIAILVIGVIYFHKKYKEIFSIDYLWDNNYCTVVDESGKTIVDKDTGSIFGRNGIYSTEYCVFHPLMISDSEFREKALTLYDTSKIFTSIKNFFNGTWRLPDQNLIKTDPVLSTMILNPWYTSDDVFYTPNTIQYTYDLKTFIVDGKEFYSFENDGLYSSFFKQNINANNMLDLIGSCILQVYEKKGEKVYDDYTEVGKIEVKVEDVEIVTENIIGKVKLEIIRNKKKTVKNFSVE